MSSIQEYIGGDLFANTFNGPGTGLTAIPRSAFVAGTASAVLVNDVSGNVSSIGILDSARGGTGQNSSASSGLVRLTAGTWAFGASVVDADVSAAAAIVRTKLASGTANAVVINDGSGNLSSETQLATLRGGTGQNSSASSGVAKVAAGTWSFASVVDADVSATAAIARTKLAAGTVSAVLVNDTSGNLSSEAQLATLRGGTGQNFSGIGVGPFVATVSSGAFSATVGYGTAAAANTIVQRDGSSNITAATANLTTVAAVGDLTLTAGSGNVQLGTAVIHNVPVTVAGGDSYSRIANVQTADATPTPILTFATASGTHGTSYVFRTLLTCADVTGGVRTALFSYFVKVKNLAGTLTASSLLQNSTIIDSGFAPVADVTVSGTNVIFRVTGVAATTINWTGRVDVVLQQF